MSAAHILREDRQTTQQTRYVYTMLIQYWTTAFNVGPTLNRHWVNISCLLWNKLEAWSVLFIFFCLRNNWKTKIPTDDEVQCSTFLSTYIILSINSKFTPHTLNIVSIILVLLPWQICFPTMITISNRWEYFAGNFRTKIFPHLQKFRK